MHCRPYISHRLVILLILAGWSGSAWSKDILVEKMGFIQNVGQVEDEHGRSRMDIDYKIGTSGLSVFVNNKGLQYQWYKESHIPHVKEDPNFKDSVTIELYAVQVKLIGADTNVRPVTEGPQPYYENYYLPNCYGKTAHSYSKVVYHNVYPNIDWVLYTSNEGGFKYDFVVHKGGKVSDIKIRYSNTSELRMKDNDLFFATPLGSIEESRPYTYDAVTKANVASRYILDGDVLSFDVAKQDEVIIDPVVNWCTYFNRLDSWHTPTAADSFGNSYVCGTTYSPDNFATRQAHQELYGGGASDGLIAQISNDGTTLNWCTYYGGEAEDEIYRATCDNAGYLYVTGMTMSYTKISGGGAHQAFNGSAIFQAGGGDKDAFLTKFNSAGIFQWGTYIGGHGNEYGYALACDAFNSIYIGGSSASDDSLYTPGAFQSTGNTGVQFGGFFAKYNTINGSRRWSTFYNGIVESISIANNNSVYIGGYSRHYSGVGTPGSYQSSYIAIGNSPIKGFISRFKADGTKVWGSYYGHTEIVYSIASDSLYNLYIGGIGVLAKMDSNGVLKWSQGFNGVATSMLLTPDNKLFIAGTTNSNNSEYTSLYKYNTEGKMLFSARDRDTSLASFGHLSYGKRRLYFGSNTTLPVKVTPGSFQTQFVVLGRQTTYLTQYLADTNVYIRFPYIDTILCAGGPLNVSYGVTNTFRQGNVFTIQLSDVTGGFTNPVNIGATTYNEDGEIACTIPVGTPEGVGYRVRIVSSAPTDTFYCYDRVCRISRYHQPRAVAMQPVCVNLSVTMTDTTSPPAPADTKYKWISPDVTRPPGQFTPNTVNGLTHADAGNYVVVANNHGCIKSDTFKLEVNDAPDEPTVIGDTSLCIGDTLYLTARSPVADVVFAWFMANGSFNPRSYDSVVTVPAVGLTDRGLYRISASYKGCQSDPAYGQIVTVHPLPLPSANSNSPVCIGDTLKLTASDTITSVSYSWTGPQGFIHNRKDSSVKNVTMNFSGQYTVKTTTIHGCENTANTTVTIKPLPNDVGISSNSPVCTAKELLLNAGNQPAGTVFSWTGPNSYSGQQQYSIRNNITLNDAGIYKLRVSLDGCIKEDTTRVFVNESPEKPKLSSNSPLLTGEVLKLNIDNAQQGLNYNWTGPKGFISQATDPTVNNVIPAMSGVYTATVSNGICTAYDTIMVIITDKKDADPSSMLIFPNPNNGVFRIKGKTQLDAVIELVVFASDGKKVYKTSIKPVNKQVDENITISGLASGIYRLRLWIDGEPQTISFTVKQ